MTSKKNCNMLGYLKTDAFERHIARLHQQICFYISFAFVTLSGRFRVGFGVGHISNKIEH